MIEGKKTNEKELADQLISHQAHDDKDNWRDLFPELIGQSKPLLDVLKFVSKISSSSSSVLIYGESGTGKELIAFAIHRLSKRFHHCFIPINCSAIPEELLESELFGHEKGAFTGADRKRIGHFGAAEKGTIFLDEIGDMPLRLQSKLLRVLQEKTYTPVGSNSIIKSDVRIIAATNKDLEQAIQNKTFRLDLFYRLNVLPLTLPPLRERPGDIEMLITHFCEQMNRLHLPESACWFDASAVEVLKSYSWPGNVRQLHNFVERLIIVHEGGRISSKDIPREYYPGAEASSAVSASPKPPVLDNQKVLENNTDLLLEDEGLSPYTLPEGGLDLAKLLEKIETDLIEQALKRTNNNKNQASKLLSLNRTTLVEKIKKRTKQMFEEGKKTLNL